MPKAKAEYFDWQLYYNSLQWGKEGLQSKAISRNKFLSKWNIWGLLHLSDNGSLWYPRQRTRGRTGAFWFLIFPQQAQVWVSEVAYSPRGSQTLSGKHYSTNFAALWAIWIITLWKHPWRESERAGVAVSQQSFMSNKRNRRLDWTCSHGVLALVPSKLIHGPLRQCLACLATAPDSSKDQMEKTNA